MATTNNPDDGDRTPRRRDLQRRARAKARAEGTNYTTALRQLMVEQAAAAAAAASAPANATGTGAAAVDSGPMGDRVRFALARLKGQRSDEPYDPSSGPEWPDDEDEFPTTRQLIDRHLDGALLEDLGLLHPGAPERTYPSDVFMDVDLPDQASDAEIIEMHVDTSTRDLYPVEEYEGGTEIVHVEAQAAVAIRALVRTEDLPSLGAHSVLEPDIDEGWTQVRFDRRVVVEFDATVDVGAETAELEYAGATQMRS